MIGIDPADAVLFVPWVEDFFRGQGGDPGAQELMETALDKIRAYWIDALSEAMERSRTTSRRLRVTSGALDNRRSPAERHGRALDVLTVLVLAALETTRGELGYLWRHLATHPEDRRRLVEEPELIPSAVEETVRHPHTIIFGEGALGSPAMSSFTGSS